MKKQQAQIDAILTKALTAAQAIEPTAKAHAYPDEDGIRWVIELELYKPHGQAEELSNANAQEAFSNNLPAVAFADSEGDGDGINLYGWTICLFNA